MHLILTLALALLATATMAESAPPPDYEANMKSQLERLEKHGKEGLERFIRRNGPITADSEDYERKYIQKAQQLLKEKYNCTYPCE